MGPEINKDIPEPKVVSLPDREVLARKLQELGVYGISPQTNGFFHTLTENLSDRTLNGMGVYMAWNLASATALANEIPIVRAGVDMYFDRVISALVPDPEVVDHAKAMRQMILEEAQKRAKAAEPKIDELGPEDSLEDFERFTQALRVNEILQEYVKDSYREGSGHHLQDDNNPFYRQTHRGFFLEYYYGTPAQLWTPWGEYRLKSDGGRLAGDEAEKELLGRLGATMHRPELNKREGTIGPIYAVHSVDGVELPDPVERPRSAYKEYDEADKAWNELVKKYYESKSHGVPLTSAEKYALDQAIIAERAKKELPLGDESDIKELVMLSFYRGKVVKYTRDEGKTWHYTKLGMGEAEYFQGGNLGFQADQEVLPNAQVHASYALTAEDFDKGMVVRPATEEEVEGMKFSYEFNEQES